MKTWVKTAAAGAAVTAAAAVAVSRAAVRLLLSQALDREEPWILKTAAARLAGRPKNDPGMETAAEAALRLKDAPLERVELTARDGTRLAGHWYGNENAARVIVAMHGWRGSWYKDFAMIAPFWFEHGCSVLFAEQRGQGESGGHAMAFGVLERYDCLDWVEWANARCGTGLPVYLAGISMGATTVLMAAGLGGKLPGNVRGVMADCGFTSPEAIWRHVTENNWHLPYGLWKRQINRLAEARLQCAPGAVTTLDAMREAKLPVLFVHGEADSFVPASMTVENFEACASPKKRLLLVPGARHGLSWLVEPERYKAEVLAFWNDCEECEGMV